MNKRNRASRILHARSFLNDDTFTKDNRPFMFYGYEPGINKDSEPFDTTTQDIFGSFTPRGYSVIEKIKLCYLVTSGEDTTVNGRKIKFVSGNNYDTYSDLYASLDTTKFYYMFFQSYVIKSDLITALTTTNNPDGFFLNQICVANLYDWPEGDSYQEFLDGFSFYNVKTINPATPNWYPSNLETSDSLDLDTTITSDFVKFATIMEL